MYLIKVPRKRVDHRKYFVFKNSVISPLEIKVAGRVSRISFHGSGAAEAVAAEIGQLGREGRRSFLVVDAVVAQAQAAFVERAFGATPHWTLPSGESSKSLTMLGAVWDFLAAERADRGSVLWVFGGGVAGDLGGFAAASYLRGIECVQVPTTLLAMVDSSVGGKTGLNLAAGKNLAGAFHQPRAVHICPELLHTLPPREFAAGAAEVIKYGLLADAVLFADLERQPLVRGHPRLAAVIRRCCEIKAGIVAADERETAAEGGRALLNLGHTFAHAIEQVAGYGTYLHGEAVGAGLVAAAALSVRIGLLAGADAGRVTEAVAAHGLPVRLREPLALAALHDAMTRDKKNRSGGLRFVVLERLGAAATRSGVPLEQVEAVWRDLGAV